MKEVVSLPGCRSRIPAGTSPKVILGDPPKLLYSRAKRFGYHAILLRSFAGIPAAHSWQSPPTSNLITRI